MSRRTGSKMAAKRTRKDCITIVRLLLIIYNIKVEILKSSPPPFGCWRLFTFFREESLQKELDEAKSATSSMEASKDALEAELQQQKDALASLEEKMQEQTQLAEAQQEAKVALEAKLQETFASETALKSELEATNEASSALEAKFLESQALETSLTRELQESKEAEAASIQLKNQLMSQLQNADERVSTLTVDLTAAQDGTQGGSKMEHIDV